MLAPSPQSDEGEEIVATAKKTDLKQCLLAVGVAGLEAL